MSIALSDKQMNNINEVVALGEAENLYNGHDALLILGLALAILNTRKAIREAAKRIKKKGTPTAIYLAGLVLKANDPVAMIKNCLYLVD